MPTDWEVSAESLREVLAEDTGLPTNTEGPPGTPAGSPGAGAVIVPSWTLPPHLTGWVSPGWAVSSEDFLHFHPLFPEIDIA